MLILTLKYEDSINLFNSNTGDKIGTLKRIKPRMPNEKLLIGFDVPKYIRIVRDKALIKERDSYKNEQEV